MKSPHVSERHGPKSNCGIAARRLRAYMNIQKCDTIDHRRAELHRRSVGVIFERDPDFLYFDLNHRETICLGSLWRSRTKSASKSESHERDSPRSELQS